MKFKYAYCLLATSIAAMVSSVSLAQASSIQIMPPSTTKFQVIGTKMKISPKPVAKAVPEKTEMQAKPVAAKTPMPQMPVMAKKPQMPVMPQMRTGEAELPIIQVNEAKNK